MTSGDMFYPVVWWEGISGGRELGGGGGSSEWEVRGGAACWDVWVLWGRIGTVDGWSVRRLRGLVEEERSFLSCRGFSLGGVFER